MTRPGNKLLQFARSSERGKTERVGGSGSPAASRDKAVNTGRGHASPALANGLPSADSLWSSSHINFHHKRPNGTFNNGPRLEYEVTGVLVRAVITVALVAALAASCVWLLNRFLEAEPAIIHSISLDGGK